MVFLSTVDIAGSVIAYHVNKPFQYFYFHNISNFILYFKVTPYIVHLDVITENQEEENLNDSQT